MLLLLLNWKCYSLLSKSTVLSKLKINVANIPLSPKSCKHFTVNLVRVQTTGKTFKNCPFFQFLNTVNFLKRHFQITFHYVPILTVIISMNK